MQVEHNLLVAHPVGPQDGLVVLGGSYRQRGPAPSVAEISRMNQVTGGFQVETSAVHGYSYIWKFSIDVLLVFDQKRHTEKVIVSPCIFIVEGVFSLCVVFGAAQIQTNLIDHLHYLLKEDYWKHARIRA